MEAEGLSARQGCLWLVALKHVLAVSERCCVRPDAPGVTATAELASSLGCDELQQVAQTLLTCTPRYLRFSQPVVIRSLFARWAKDWQLVASLAETCPH
eukprot:434380-Amphidinium_carterae.1